jgi:hypothetical protein
MGSKAERLNYVLTTKGVFYLFCYIKKATFKEKLVGFD